MTPEDFTRLLRKHADDIRHAYADRWPRIMRKEAIDHFRSGFRLGGFVDSSLERWDVTRRQTVPFNGAAAKRTPLNSVSGDLLHSIDAKTEPGAITVYSDSPHARYHNEGADATVTPRMRRFFWARHADAKRRFGKDNPETDFWRNMALTRKTKIHIPRRHFLGSSKTLSSRIRAVLEQDLKKLLDL